jgi:sensor domain CHASE-containing protein
MLEVTLDNQFLFFFGFEKAFFVNRTGQIVLQSDRKQMTAFFLELRRPSQAVKLALGT